MTTNPQTNNQTVANDPFNSVAENQTPKPDVSNTAPALSPSQTPQPTFTPVWVGGKQITSQDELVRFAEDTHTKAIELQSKVPSIQTSPIPSDPDKELADLMFEDPVTYTKIIQDRANEKVEAKITFQKAQERAWEKFYTDHQDLKGYDDLVNVMLGKMPSDFSKKPLEQAMNELGQATRGRLAEIRKSPTGGETLPSGQALTAGPSGGPGIPVPSTHKQKNFLEQFAEMRSKIIK